MICLFLGSYDTPEMLTDTLNELTEALNIPRLKNKKLFSFDKINKKFSLIVHDLWITMMVKKKLVNILGLQLKHYIPSQVAFIGLSKQGDHFEKDKVKYMFKEPELTWKTDDKDGGECPYAAQMVTVSSFLVYSNIVKKSLIGSTYTNSLRHVSLKGAYGEQIIETFSTIGKLMIVRLQRWSFFSCDAMAMFYFLQRCDIDYFLTFPTIAIIAIIFPNHRDRLFSNVCIILRFLGVFEGFWRFWVFEVLRGERVG